MRICRSLSQHQREELLRQACREGLRSGGADTGSRYAQSASPEQPQAADVRRPPQPQIRQTPQTIRLRRHPRHGGQPGDQPTGASFLRYGRTKSWHSTQGTVLEPDALLARRKPGGVSCWYTGQQSVLPSQHWRVPSPFHHQAEAVQALDLQGTWTTDDQMRFGLDSIHCILLR